MKQHQLTILLRKPFNLTVLNRFIFDTAYGSYLSSLLCTLNNIHTLHYHYKLKFEILSALYQIS